MSEEMKETLETSETVLAAEEAVTAEDMTAEAGSAEAAEAAAPAEVAEEKAPAEAEAEKAPADADAAEAAAHEELTTPQEPEKVETMEDFAAELEASYKRVRVGDILTGTVVGVTDDKVLLDLKYYAGGIIDKENLSNDPNLILAEEFHPGDEITGTVISTDDGEGNIVLSRKEANDILAWEKLARMLEERTVVPVSITGIVKGGVVAELEGIRAFIPASKVAAGYVEDLNEYLGKTIDVTVITADPEAKRLVLSGKEPARAKLAEEKNKKIARCEVGAVMEGTVDSLKDYGAFINLENGLSGLLHVSQISSQRIKHPGAVLKEGQTVKVKIIGIKDNKISLSMKALEEALEAPEEHFDYHEDSQATTGLGSLLKGLKF